jgi:hypothetical protein
MNVERQPPVRSAIEESQSELGLHPATGGITVNEGDPNIVLPDSAGSVDDLLRHELAQLSLKDKLDLEDEIHGFYCRAPPETPDLIRENRNAMRRYIDTLPDEKKMAYLEARRIQLQYQGASIALVVHVLKDEYLLRFLRAELHDSHKAAIRYCNWLNIIVKHFGEVALTRPLYVADVAGSGTHPIDENVSRDASRLLKEGWFYLFPTRDRAGRRIIAHIGKIGLDCTPLARVRVV